MLLTINNYLNWILFLTFAFFFILNCSRSIIELGCGTGLTGLVICSTSSPCRYIFTDCHERVLETLQCNLELNGYVQTVQAGDKEQTSLSSCSNKSTVCTSNVDDILETSQPGKGSIICADLIKDSNQRTFHMHPEVANSYNNQDSESDFESQSAVFPNCKACAVVADTCNIASDGFGLSSSKTVNITACYSRKSASCLHLNKDCGRHSGSVPVEVCKLEWETFTKSDLKTFSDIDIILAAGMQALILYIYRPIAK